MIINENMLKCFIDIPDNIKDLTNDHIIEVDDFSLINETTKLVTGKVLTRIDHPNSDHLSITTVDVGNEVLDIVCGAPNVKAGQYVIVALVGATFKDGFTIKPTKIRGVSSNGMICSLNELGIDKHAIEERFQNGIFYFDNEVKLGVDALDLLSQNGFSMTLGLTPNRSDLLSVLGYAYDLASVINKKVTLPKVKIKEGKEVNPFSVKIESNKCGRYYLRHLTNITIKESPWFIKSALLNAGIMPINNVVDITNYCLLEYGTPLHAFDASKVKTNMIVVRNGLKNESVVTLDEQKRLLTSDDIVITNGKEAIAIGGVMGLENTMIDENTTSIALEAAYFDQKSVANTSKRLNLKSDSSLRFERGIDDKRVILGLERATELLVLYANATVSKGIKEDIKYELEDTIIEVSIKKLNESLNTTLSKNMVVDILKRLNYQINSVENSDLITVIPPSYRRDVAIFNDIIEEVARIYGLNKIANKPLLNVTKGSLTPYQKSIRQIRHHLAHVGFNETINYSLVSKDDVKRFNDLGVEVAILSPLSEDKKYLRQSLINGLLETISYNKNRQQDDIALFEIGHVYEKNHEVQNLAITCSGKWIYKSWEKINLNTDFFLLKGVLDKLFNYLKVDLEYLPTNSFNNLHPYQQALINYQGKTVGFIGLLHPNTCKMYDINKTVVCEINLDLILKDSNETKFAPISKYPNIRRDLAIVVDESILVNDILKTIKETVKNELVTLEVFDVYQGSNIKEGYKSVAFSLTFNKLEKTLVSEEVDKLMKKISNRLNYLYKAEIRA